MATPIIDQDTFISKVLALYGNNVMFNGTEFFVLVHICNPVSGTRWDPMDVYLLQELAARFNFPGPVPGYDHIVPPPAIQPNFVAVGILFDSWKLFQDGHVEGFLNSTSNNNHVYYTSLDEMRELGVNSTSYGVSYSSIADQLEARANLSAP